MHLSELNRRHCQSVGLPRISAYYSLPASSPFTPSAFIPTLLRAILLLGCMLQYAASQGSQSDHPSPQLPQVAFLSLPLPAWFSLPPAIPRAERPTGCLVPCHQCEPPKSVQPPMAVSNGQRVFVFGGAGVGQPARWPLQFHCDPLGCATLTDSFTSLFRATLIVLIVHTNRRGECRWLSYLLAVGCHARIAPATLTGTLIASLG